MSPPSPATSTDPFDYPDVVLPEPPARAGAEARRALSWTGWRVQDFGGARLGRVAGVLVDRQTGEPIWLHVVDSRGRYRCVPFAGVVAGAGRITVAQSRRQVDRTPLLAPDGALTSRLERELCRTYGVPLTRGARLSTWERRRSTARAFAAPDAPAGYLWTPPARDGRDRRSGLDRRAAGGRTPALSDRRSVPTDRRGSPDAAA